MAKEINTLPVEGKAEIEQHELYSIKSPEVGLKAGHSLEEAYALGQQESGFEGLTAWETIKKFKRASFYCFLVTFAAATDGYQVRQNRFWKSRSLIWIWKLKLCQISMNGNIVANVGRQASYLSWAVKLIFL